MLLISLGDLESEFCVFTFIISIIELKHVSYLSRGFMGHAMRSLQNFFTLNMHWPHVHHISLGDYCL